MKFFNMKFSKLCIVFLFLTSVFAGCASSGSSADNQVELGDYSFTMYGSGGAKIADGIMTVKNITVKDANMPEFTGTYTVSNWYTDDFGPKSTMGGDFSGNADYTKGKIFVNEINTIPGFTKISMYPKLWEASGISYTDLIDRLIQLAIERFKKEQQLKTSYIG